MENKEKSVLVVCGKNFPKRHAAMEQFDTIVANRMFEGEVKKAGAEFVEIDALVGPGNIYEGSDFAKGLSLLYLPGGERVTKAFLYKGHELWWMHYNSLFLQFGLPYTQYKDLLSFVKDFDRITFYEPPYRALFACFLEAYKKEARMIYGAGVKAPAILPFGVFLQILLTLVSIPALMVLRKPVLVYTGDKFEKDKDYDFRLGFVYKELRARNIRFVEFVRSLEPWKTVLGHAITRRRPVIYPEAVVFVARFMSVITGGHRRGRKQFGARAFGEIKDPEKKFKALVSTQYLITVHDDVWAIRIVRGILALIGVKAAMLVVASERNFPTTLACKVRGIPTVGIMHGVASPAYNVSDFQHAFDGEKRLSVDRYGVWSDWWKERYLENGKAYKADQLFVSGPMRPVDKAGEFSQIPEGRPIKTLYIAEQTVDPRESMPYLEELLKHKDIELTIKFRPYRDGFEDWLLERAPHILKNPDIKIMKGGMQEAIAEAHVVVGCHSTGVLEALLQSKPLVFARSQKWGDYYNMTGREETKQFFAENPEELIARIRNIHTVSPDLISKLQDQYFGNPEKNGSAWTVDQVEEFLNI